MRISKLFIAASLAAIAVSPAMAHRPWFLPSTTTLGGTTEAVTVDAAVSNDLFYPDHFPMPLDQVKVWQPDGSEGKLINPATGLYRSTFDVKIDQPGTWKIGTERTSIMGSFKVNGEEWRVGGRRPGPPPGGPGAPAAQVAPRPAAPAGEGGPAFTPRPSVASVADIPANATDIKLVENVQRNFIFVSADAPTTTVFVTGKGLELQPVTHPNALVSDEEAQFRFLIDGKPAADVKVSVVPGGKKYRQDESAQDLTTGPDGVVRIKWPVAGFYWINATASDSHPSDPKATERRMTFTTTVEVVAP